ncbi:hypothetical protein [Neptunomonas sp.]|uniref:hypothetical protein n=1 Tax=Neptunomonas sp. TaxID=1971898 RepID=UPI0025FA5EDC|nr:hypothetical protein [Neptunomonas sp.]
MKDIELLGVGLRLLGIACIIFAIGKTGEGISFIYQYSNIDLGVNPIIYKITVWLPLIFIYAVGIFFIKFPILCAKKFLQKTSAKTEDIDFNQSAITISGLILLGIYLLTIAIPDLAYNILYLYQQNSLGYSDTPQISETYIHFIFTAIQFSLGLYLALGASGIYKFICRLRS